MQNDYTFEYGLLDRLRQDCEYYIGNGNRNPKNLWAGDVISQIKKMIELYEMLPAKPEWLTEDEIKTYRYVMTHDTEKEMLDGIECNTWKVKDGNGTVRTAYCFKVPGWDRITVLGKKAAKRIIRGRSDAAVRNTLGIKEQN